MFTQLRQSFRRLKNFDPGRFLDRLIGTMDAKTDNLAPLIYADKNAKPRQSFASGLPPEEQFSAKLTLRNVLEMLTVQPKLMYTMFKSGRYYQQRFSPRADTAEPDFYSELEALAKRMGAVSIGYVNDIPRNEIFRDKGIPHQNAIVFTVEMDKEAMKSAPSFDAFHEVGKGYKNLAVISNALTDFVRSHGYAAYPGTSLGGLTDYVALAERAGLGAIGYHGLLIGPDGGARLRINTIYTNLSDLPVRDNPHLWVRDFCAKCKKCVRSCPPGAIYDEPQAREGGGKTCIDYPTCLNYFSANFGCAVCLAVCPFSNAGYDKIRDGFVKTQQKEAAKTA